MTSIATLSPLFPLAAFAAARGAWLYQLIGDGLALQRTIKGTKYFKDGDVN